MTTLHSIATDFDPQQTTTFSIPSETQVDVEGFLAWVHMPQDVPCITTLEIAGDVIYNLYAVVIANTEQCRWGDVMRLVHRMIRLETLEIPCSVSTAEIFPVMLEDLLLLLAPSMRNFKRFCVSRQVHFGHLSGERMQLLSMTIPSSIEEFIVTDVDFRGPARPEQGPTILQPFVEDGFASILSRLSNLKRLEIQFTASWNGPSSLGMSNWKLIFRHPSLRHVSLRNMRFVNDDLDAIAGGLKLNCSLEAIHLTGPYQNQCKQGYERILRLMEHQFYVKEFNCSFHQEVDADSATPRLQEIMKIMKMIASFAKLNAADRRRILCDERSTREDLFQLIEIVLDDPNAIFTIFRSHPQIIYARESW